MTVTPDLKGSITALITPFRGGRIDWTAFEALVERQVRAGSHGVVPVGTTGESPTLTMDEHIEVIRRCVGVVDKRIPVIAGAGSNDTAAALELARAADEAGADALLTVTGYYNKPSQAGLYAHFEAVATATRLPLVIYNVPGRTASTVSVGTLARLARLAGVMAVKDATGDLARVATQRLACGPDFIQLSGEDATVVGFNAMGGRGCISVTSNVAPELCAALQTACLGADWAEALALQDRLTPLTEALFADTNPAPVKYALSRLGLCTAELRLPLVEASKEARLAVDAALAGLELI